MAESTPAEDQLKTCRKCDEAKQVDAFYIDRRTGKPLGQCRACCNARSRERYAQDPNVRARQKAHNARWFERNPDFRVEYHRKNREKSRAASAAYYRNNREKHIAAAVEYAKRNPVDPEHRRQRETRWRRANAERLTAVKRAWRKNNAERHAEGNRRAMARRRARLRGLPVESYTMDQLIDRDGTACVLCGEDVDFGAVYPDPSSPTVEHLECISWPDSAGDVLANVAVSHFRCNVRRGADPHPAAARKRVELLTT